MLVFETLQAHQRTNSLRAAIELKLFTAIANGAKTPEALAPVCGASEKGLRILCDFLTVVGFLTKDESGYSNTADSQLFLVQGSPAYMGGMANFLFHPFVEKGLSHILDAVRLGGTVLPAEGTVSEDNPVWIDFARGMAPLTLPAAALIAELTATPGPVKVLDIAAGHGMFGITIAKRNPAAEIYALDWKNVLAVAHENATKLGVVDRWHAIEGDAFTADCGTDYDLVLVTNFVHHFDIPTNVTLLKKLHTAMKPGATLAILEMAVNDDRVSPPGAALFAMTMLTSTRSGDAFSRRELESMCVQAGFQAATHHEVTHTPSTVTLAKK
jgi:2-polyprenyl-3-methyl-5-hydroxy-6-metoxy-1,4-benzoquinol methylase